MSKNSSTKTAIASFRVFFSLSYYGFMRPDVLISYLFPHVEMEWFIQGYAIFEILLGGGLLYPPAADWYRDFFFLQKNAKGSTDKKQHKISCDQVPDLLIM